MRVVPGRPFLIGVLLALIACACVLSPASAYAAAEPPGAPAWVSPAGGWAAGMADVVVTAGSATSSMTVGLNGAVIGSAECTTGASIGFGRVSMPAGLSTFTVVASSPDGQTRRYDYTVRRLDYAWPTCIIVDKSDYRLYWIRDGVLVKAYPIAHGKRSTQTPNSLWIVGRKEKTPPTGVYGPRKLRLFQRVVINRRAGAVRYRRTSYGIHGTNQPWVIGTMASHGCIRLFNTDILELWPQVPLGTPVLTRP